MDSTSRTGSKQESQAQAHTQPPVAMDAALGMVATAVDLQPLIASLMRPPVGIVKDSGSQTHRHHPHMGMGAVLGMEATVVGIQLRIAIRVHKSVKDIVWVNGKVGNHKLIRDIGIIPFCVHSRVLGSGIFS